MIIPFHEDLFKLFNSVKSVNNQIIKRDTRLEIIIGNDSNFENQEIRQQNQNVYEKSKENT